MANATDRLLSPARVLLSDEIGSDLLAGRPEGGQVDEP